MKKHIILALASVLALVGCKHFDEMSQNPYALENAPAEEFVHPIMFRTEYSLISVFRGTTSQLMQYALNKNTEETSQRIEIYNIAEAAIDDIWVDLYPQYANALRMYQNAVTEENTAMQAVSLILRSLLITQISDAYGNVPFVDAGQLGLIGAGGKYTTHYDDQKDIYRSVIVMLETANKLLAESTTGSFTSSCDKVFGGDLDKWRRFGNTLYARVLMRIAMKVEEEDGGILQLNDDVWGAVSVKARLTELYACYTGGDGDYPVMRGLQDRPVVPFSKDNETENTPFYSTTSGIWNSIIACDALTRLMLDYDYKQDSDGIWYYEYKPKEKGGHIEDPRYDCWWRKTCGAPAQLYYTDLARFLDNAEHKSSKGNTKMGSMPRAVDANGQPEASAITGKVYDLKNASGYALMNFSELAFIFAEAGARGYIASISGKGAYRSLLEAGITQSILEWNPYVTATSPDVTEYVDYVITQQLYSGKPFVDDSCDPLEVILTQKWLSNFFIGIEGWCDYRRTGYPLLKTNGPAAGNDCILPTRLRYPSDEAYRNEVYFQEAVNGWLGGTNNMKTDVWWASTEESYNTRLRGRQ